jgi:hypothetical protein
LRFRVIHICRVNGEAQRMVTSVFLKRYWVTTEKVFSFFMLCEIK